MSNNQDKGFIATVKLGPKGQSLMLKIAKSIISGTGQSIYPDEDPDGLEDFAQHIRNTSEEDSE